MHEELDVGPPSRGKRGALPNPFQSKGDGKTCDVRSFVQSKMCLKSPGTDVGAAGFEKVSQDF